MGVVYMRTCESGLVYYGSTTTSLKERRWQGWSSCSCKDFINPILEVLEQIDNDKLIEREMWYIQNNTCVNQLGKYLHLTRSEYKAQWCENNKDTRKEQRAQHYQDNKNKIKETKAQYYQDNKDKISEKKKIKINCDRCGSLVRKSEIVRHHKSNKCISKSAPLM